MKFSEMTFAEKRRLCRWWMASYVTQVAVWLTQYETGPHPRWAIEFAKAFVWAFRPSDGRDFHGRE